MPWDNAEIKFIAKFLNCIIVKTDDTFLMVDDFNIAFMFDQCHVYYLGEIKRVF